jgi:hypothetical protein
MYSIYRRSGLTNLHEANIRGARRRCRTFTSMVDPLSNEDYLRSDEYQYRSRSLYPRDKQTSYQQYGQGYSHHASSLCDGTYSRYTSSSPYDGTYFRYTSSSPYDGTYSRCTSSFPYDGTYSRYKSSWLYDGIYSSNDQDGYSPQYPLRAEPHVKCEEREPRRSTRVRWADQESSPPDATRLDCSSGRQRYEVRVPRENGDFNHTPCNEERKRRPYSYTPDSMFANPIFERQRAPYSSSRSYERPVSPSTSFSDSVDYEIRSPRPRFSGPPTGSAQYRTDQPHITGKTNLREAARRAMNRVPDYDRYRCYRYRPSW